MIKISIKDMITKTNIKIKDIKIILDKITIDRIILFNNEIIIMFYLFFNIKF